MLGGGRKPEDGKEETQRKKHVVYHVNSLLLNNNEIRDIKGLYPVLKEYVLFEPDRLQWLNLSYNYLVKIDADILDLRTLAPLDIEAIYASATKCGRVIVLHEDSLTGGIGAEISALITEHCFEFLDAPVMRCGSLDTPVPFQADLEVNYLPVERFREKLQALISY